MQRDDLLCSLGDIYTAVLKWQDNASVVGMLEAHYDDKPDDLVDITRRMIELCDERGLKI